MARSAVAIRLSKAMPNSVGMVFPSISFSTRNSPPQLGRVERLEQAVHGVVDLLEGPNEINNDPVDFAGRSGVVGGRAYQAALYARAKADPELMGIPVLNYTNWPPTEGRADAVNVHTYAKAGVDPQAQISEDVELAAAAFPEGLPRYITETGYPTSVSPRSSPWVSQAHQADLTLISLFEAFRLGVQRVYLYELFDEGSLQPDSPEAHYGLFDKAAVPKPAARQIHALLAQLNALQTSASQFHSCSVTVEGAHSLLLTTKSGASMLLVWPFAKSRSGGSASIHVMAASPLFVRELILASDTVGPLGSSETWRIPLDDAPHVYLLTSD